VSVLSPKGPIHRRTSAALVAVVFVVSTATAGFVSADTSTTLNSFVAQTALAPTLPGAPFLPLESRTDLVLARLDALNELATLRSADSTLRIRRAIAPAEAANDPGVAGLEDTLRILESQTAALERRLADVEASLLPFIVETSEFGIGVAVFPIASLRKPFFNDWARPRSGGRRHQGNDMLAQTGVPLRAIEDGTVEQISTGSLGGLSIYLLGESGSRYYYAHLDEIGDFEDGQQIYAGQVVGAVGDSGNARGSPHLHMQWAPDGGSVWENPFPLLDILFGPGVAAAALEAGLQEAPIADPERSLIGRS
jgi:murein DD-endopeptidase MepM/ murein hydrolase activator NlpD